MKKGGTNSRQYIFSIYTVGKAGLVEVPINPSLRDIEIAHMVNNAGVTTITTESNSSFLKNIVDVAGQSSVLKNVIIKGDMPAFPNNRLNIFLPSELIKYSDGSNPEGVP